MKTWAKAFYKSKQWLTVRDAYMRSQHGLCERCGEPAKIVHHKVWLTPENINDPRISLSWGNLEALCQTCHNEEHHGKGSCVNDDLEFDSDGNLIKR
jgi:5-methylcytosine-specific restriction endonuclease McrA